MMCYLIQPHSPYPVPVRQHQPRSLAYFSPWIAPNNLATCLASRRHPRASGTFTLWDILLKNLYLPFKAHKKYKMVMLPIRSHAIYEDRCASLLIQFKHRDLFQLLT